MLGAWVKGEDVGVVLDGEHVGLLVEGDKELGDAKFFN